MNKYIFLNGKAPVVKEFKTDDEAIAEAKKDKSILRVQKSGVLKHIYEAGAQAVAKVTALIFAAAMLAFGLSVHAATTIGVLGSPGTVGYAVLSSSGGSSTSLATNGLYSSSIAAATTETNCVLLNPGGTQDGTLVLQLTASGTTTSTTNTATFLVQASAIPVAITNAPNGAKLPSKPLGTFATYTLTLNGTSPVTTNVVLSTHSTPAIANGLNLYLSSIAGNAGSASITNYSVAVAP